VTATSDPGEAVLPTAVVVASFLARITKHDVREANRVGQREREHEDAGKGHVQGVARSPDGQAMKLAGFTS
jgi:hypothetical protein